MVADLKLKKLYQDLQDFKDDAKFHKIGFGLFSISTKYKRWELEIQSLRKNKDSTFETKLIAGDLLMLGLEYIKTKGKENNYIKFVKE